MVTNSHPVALSHIERVRVSALEVHPKAQRDLERSGVKKIVDNFDMNLIGVLHAVENYENGQRLLLVVDGQHRLMALREKGYNDAFVDVQIHKDADLIEASKLFVGLNTTRPVTISAKFRTRFQAKYADAVDIVDICTGLGLTVSMDGMVGSGRHINCLAVLLKVWHVDRGVLLRDALYTLTRTWGVTVDAVDGKLVSGMAVLLRNYGKQLDRDTLVKRLKARAGGVTALIADARGMHQYRKSPVPVCVAEIMLDTYNRKARSAGRITEPDSRALKAVPAAAAPKVARKLKAAKA